jgi:hypothetical protein
VGGANAVMPLVSLLLLYRTERRQHLQHHAVPGIADLVVRRQAVVQKDRSGSHRPEAAPIGVVVSN